MVVDCQSCFFVNGQNLILSLMCRICNIAENKQVHGNSSLQSREVIQVKSMSPLIPCSHMKKTQRSVPISEPNIPMVTQPHHNTHGPISAPLASYVSLWVSVAAWDTSCGFPLILTQELQSSATTVKCTCACKYLRKTASCTHPLSVCSGHVQACSLVCVCVCVHMFFLRMEIQSEDVRSLRFVACGVIRGNSNEQD